MASKADRKPVQGSSREPIAGARQVGTPDPNEIVDVTVYLRRKSVAGDTSTNTVTAGSLANRTYLSRDQFEEAQAADPKDVVQIEAFATEHHLSVGEVSLPRRSVVLSGTLADLSEAFGVTLTQFETLEGIRYRGRSGPITAPADIADIVQGVFGLDDRPQVRPHFRWADEHTTQEATRATSGAFLPPQVAQLYNFPAGDGTGQCVAIIELGGGFRVADLRTYFQSHHLQLPRVTAVSVDGARNKPSGNADAEVMLDIEVVGAIAGKTQIAVYFAPNTDRGFLDAITTAVHDHLRQPSVISISWGGAESQWTSQAMTAMDQAFQDAAALGVSVCCASGDSGSGDGVNDQLAHVDFPASSPFALACGGTRLTAAGTTIAQEIVWNESTGGATGGGVSDQFGKPAYQAHANVPKSVNPGNRVGRGVPDIAGDADPQTGYIVRVDGHEGTIGGTSAVAPLWAALIAILNQKLPKPVGFVNPLLYSAASAGMHDITSGNNGQYKAGTGWDACTGWGSPDGARLLQLLAGS
jgi:kumamolisin